MELSICDSIKRKYIRLSKGQRKVAQFVLDNPAVVANQVAVEVGRLAGVSESTVIRFCYAIELAGFSELQQKMKQYLIETGSKAAQIVAEPTPTKKQNASMLEDIEEISNMMSKISLEQFENSARILHNAKQIHILGFTHSTPAAIWLYDNLHAIRNGVRLHKYSNLLTNEMIINVEQETVLVIFIENRQCEAVNKILCSMDKSHVKVIAIAYDDRFIQHPNIEVLLNIGTPKEHDDYCAVGVFSVLRAIVRNMYEIDQSYKTNRKESQVIVG